MTINSCRKPLSKSYRQLPHLSQFPPNPSHLFPQPSLLSHTRKAAHRLEPSWANPDFLAFSSRLPLCSKFDWQREDPWAWRRRWRRDLAGKKCRKSWEWHFWDRHGRLIPDCWQVRMINGRLAQLVAFGRLWPWIGRCAWSRIKGWCMGCSEWRSSFVDLSG